MSKKLSFRNKIAAGEQQRIKLSTLKGKQGYRITKFQTISAQNASGGDAGEHFTFIWSVKQSSVSTTTPNIDFSDSQLLAVNWSPNNVERPFANAIIFDNAVFNQDIYITHMDILSGSSDDNNYYIELEVVNLSDLEATYLTLQNIRTIAERTA